jgi:hypothetical protein
VVGEQEEHQVRRAVLDSHGNPRRSSVIIEPPDWKSVALVDALRGGTLNPAQMEALRALRVGLVALSEQLTIGDVKVPV